MVTRQDTKICQLCGAIMGVGEVCDCMINAPRIAGREYQPVRRKDGSVVYFGFPVRMVSNNERNTDSRNTGE